MKQVIVLTITNPWPVQNSIEFCMWASVPTARTAFYVQSSTWQSVYAGATTTELAALRAGQYTEQVQIASLPISATVANVKTVLQDAFTIFQNSINNSTAWQYYGSSYDGSSWTLGGF